MPFWAINHFRGFFFRRNKNLHPVLWAPFCVAGLMVTYLPGKSECKRCHELWFYWCKIWYGVYPTDVNHFAPVSGSHLNQTVVRRNIFTGHGSGKTKWHIIENLFCMYVPISARHENDENNKHSLRTTMGIINYSISDILVNVRRNKKTRKFIFILMEPGTLSLKFSKKRTWFLCLVDFLENICILWTISIQTKDISGNVLNWEA